MTDNVETLRPSLEDAIQERCSAQYQVGWDDGYAEGRAKATTASAARIEALTEALQWYATLPPEWVIKVGGGLTYGTLHLLGERARTTLAALDAAPRGEGEKP